MNFLTGKPKVPKAPYFTEPEPDVPPRTQTPMPRRSASRSQLSYLADDAYGQADLRRQQRTSSRGAQLYPPLPSPLAQERYSAPSSSSTAYRERLPRPDTPAFPEDNHVTPPGDEEPEVAHYDDPMDEPPAEVLSGDSPPAERQAEPAEPEQGPSAPARPRPRMGRFSSEQPTTIANASRNVQDQSLPFRPGRVAGPSMLLQDMRVHTEPVPGEPGVFQVELRYRVRVQDLPGLSSTGQ